MVLASWGCCWTSRTNIQASSACGTAKMAKAVRRLAAPPDSPSHLPHPDKAKETRWKEGTPILPPTSSRDPREDLSALVAVSKELSRGISPTPHCPAQFSENLDSPTLISIKQFSTFSWRNLIL